MDRSNLRALMGLPDRQERLCHLLTFMQMHGQSVLLGWGEDDNGWECSWITGGIRFASWAKGPADAVAMVARQVADIEPARVWERGDIR